MTGEENPLVAGILSGIAALLIGWALASTPSELQAAGVMIIMVGIMVLVTSIVSLVMKISQSV